MRKLFLLYLLLVTPLLFNSAQSQAATLLVLGDSISAGYGIDYGKGWVEQLQQAVRNEYTVVNASISGDTTGGGLSRLETLLDTYQPEFIIIELGGNDGLRGYPIKRIKANLIELIALSRKKNASPILFAMRIPPNYGKRYSSQFADLYDDIANTCNTPIIPFIFDDLATDRTLLQADGIHPTEKAQPIITERVLTVIGPMLKGE